MVSDPFGSSDITSLQFVILSPTGTETTVTATQVASTAGTKTFEYVWPGAQHVTGGTYQIKAVATEGTEGLKVASMTTTYEVRYAISGHVINDVDGDGNLPERTTENGLAGVTVQLFADANQDGIPDSPGSPLQTVVTTGAGVYGGNYSFTDVPVGNYVIIETNPAGYTSTGDIQPPNNDAIKVTVANADITAQDFLDSLTAQIAPISGRVVNDANGNGDLGERAGEAGITGVTVQLWTDPNGDGNPADGVLYDTTVTIANGVYTFSNVPPGNYVVVETNPAATPRPTIPAGRTTIASPSSAPARPPARATISWMPPRPISAASATPSTGTRTRAARPTRARASPACRFTSTTTTTACAISTSRSRPPMPTASTPSRTCRSARSWCG